MSISIGGLGTLWVQMAFGDDPTADPSTWTWTDITSYVLTPSGDSGITIQRGGTSESGRATTSTLQISVDNTDGRFTPGYQNGAYFPNVRFRTPIRVRVYNGIDYYDRFVGFVDEWPMQWPVHPDRFAVTHITASGTLRRVARGAPVTAPLQAAIEADSPTLYWPLEDEPRSAYAMPAKGTMRLAASDVVLGSQSSAPKGCGGPVANFAAFGTLDGGDYAVNPRTIEVWWQYGLYSSSEIWLSTYSSATGYELFTLKQYGGVGGFSCSWSTLSVTTTGIPVAGEEVAPGDWWQCVAVLDGTGSSMTLKLYVNGFLRGSDGPQYATPVQPIKTMQAKHGAAASMAHLAVYSTALTSTQVAVHFYAGRAWWNETVQARMIRLCDQEGVYYDTPSTGTLMGCQRAGGNLLDLLQDCADADGGLGLFEAPSSKLHLHPRWAWYNPTALISLDVASGEVRDLTPVVDDMLMVNKATVSRPGGGPQTYEIAASIAAYDVYSQSLSPNLRTDEEAWQRAAWEVNTSSDPVIPRVESLVLDVYALDRAGLYDTWVAADLLDKRIDLTGLPTQLGYPDRMILRVAGYTEVIGPKMWTVRLNCLPGDAIYPVYRLEDGGDQSALNFDGQTVSGSVTDVATSMSIATAAGKPLLTTAAGDMPMYVRNTSTGEVFRITAVSGTSSPQTATIVRAQRGTTNKAMSAAQPLRLDKQPRLAL